MGVVIVDGAMVVDFVNNSETFGRLVNEQFDQLINHDAGNNDIGLSVKGLRKRFNLFWSMGHKLQSEDNIKNFNHAFIEKFDENQDGFIDRDEFNAMMKEFMLIIAYSVGDQPLLMALQEDSLLFKAIQQISSSPSNKNN